MKANETIRLHVTKAGKVIHMPVEMSCSRLQADEPMKAAPYVPPCSYGIPFQLTEPIWVKLWTKIKVLRAA